MIQRGLGFVGLPKNTHGNTGPDVESTFEGPAAWALFRQISLSGFMCSHKRMPMGRFDFRRGWGISHLKPRHRSALVAALASASLLALVASAAAQTTSVHGTTAKTAHKATAKAGAKSKAKKSASKSNSKKVAALEVPLPRARPGAEGADSSSQASAPARPRISPSKVPLAQAPTLETLDADIALVKRAIDALRSRGADEATRIESSISDPVARKLVEWSVLRDGDNGAEFSRYAAFIAANPTWPSVAMFRRRAEAMLWVEDASPAKVRSYFNGAPPLSAKGRLVLARALLAAGDKPGAHAQVRQAWRDEPFSAEVERQVLDEFPEFLTHADHRARMEKSLDVGESDAAMRAARRLGGAAVAIAHARIALNSKSGNATKLLEAVPAEAHHDPGYILAKVQLLRRADKVAEAGQLMLAAPRDSAQIHNPEEWWVERRVLSRKLLDSGDAKSAYLVVRDCAEPTKENSRVERHFMAGWIALRFLNEPAAAVKHFARIQRRQHSPHVARALPLLARTRGGGHPPDRRGAGPVSGGCKLVGGLLRTTRARPYRAWSVDAGAAAGHARQAGERGAARVGARAAYSLRAQ